MVSVVVARDTGAVAALRRAPLPARVVLDEEEQAVGCQTGAEPITPGAGEELDTLVRDQTDGVVGGCAIHAEGALGLSVGRPDELEPGSGERVERGDRVRPRQLGGRRRWARVLGGVGGQLA